MSRFERERAPFLQTETLRSPELLSHNRLVLYTGVSCSGKDFLLDQAMAQREGEELSRVSMGTFISQRLAVHRDEIRKQMDLPEIEQFKLTLAPEITDLQPAILVTHIVPKYDHVITLNPNFEKALKPAHFVVVVSEPDRINEWRNIRNQAGARQTPIEDPADLNLHQEMVIHNTFLISRAIGAGFSIIYNSPEPEATGQNIEFLNDVLNKI